MIQQRRQDSDNDDEMPPTTIPMRRCRQLRNAHDNDTTPTTTTMMGSRKNETDRSKMSTYRFRNVTQENAAVGGDHGSGFGPPAPETNEAQPPNTNDYGANASRTPLLSRVVNTVTTRIRGPASVGISPVNLGLTMPPERSQATGQGSVGAVTLISALTNNTGVPATTTQGVQLPLIPPTQPVQQSAGAVVVPTPAAPPKGAVVAKFLAMNDAQTKEELEGNKNRRRRRQCSKA